jgi:hypothetical protein
MGEDLGIKRTPTELVMKCLEEFGQCEAVNALVIWTDEAGDICWSATTDSQVQKFGMIEFVKQMLIKGMGE